jgi:hypothetical protein
MGDESHFKPYEQDQGVLFPAFLADALDPSDPAFFVQDAVEGLDLRAFEARYAVLGERAYAPRLMLKLWLYAATQGVYSGREDRAADSAGRGLPLSRRGRSPAGLSHDQSLPRPSP